MQRAGQSGGPIEGWCLRSSRKKWWAGTGLNRRHQDFQSCALPTELPARTTVSDEREKRIARGELLHDADDPQVAVLHEVQGHDHHLARCELARELREDHARRALA